jgi:hypothetical protein
VEAAVADIPGARLRVVGCLDLCRYSNVIGVRDWRVPEPVVTWLGRMVAPSDTAALLGFLRSGGPLPGPLRPTPSLP